MSGVSAARREAFRILLLVERGQAHADDLLRADSVSRLSVPDRHLTTALVLGVLRWQMVLDRQLRSLLARPNAKLDADVLIALRMGAFQLLHLDRIPARAAIDESVQLAKQAGHRFASGMVNAVLRKLPATSRLASSEEVATQAHPDWMVERWTRFFGPDTACAICKHNQNPPALTIRLATLEVESELAEAGIALESGELLSSARRVMSGDVTATAAFREGRARIQDEGSQLIAEIAGGGNAMPDSMPDSNLDSILDCCAAPGGKTLILAECNPTARIVACEASPSRLESLRERVASFGDRIECRHVDATALDFESEFDVVLADVPCSGTGTLSRNPEIRHRLSPEDLPRQAERQQAILASALRAVRPGGRVVYSTCSLEPEENEQVIAAVLREQENYRVSSMAAQIDRLEAGGVLASAGADRLRSCVTPEGYLRILPGIFGTDGFFIAIIEKSL